MEYAVSVRRKILLFAWLLTDIVLFIGSYILAYFLRVGFILSTDFPLEKYATIVVVIAPVWLLILSYLGVFRLTRVQAGKRNLSYILFACLMALSLFTLTYYFVYGQFFSRLLLIYAGVFSFILTEIWHAAFDQWQRHMLRKDPPSYPLLVIGANREAERMIRLLEEKQCPLKPVAVLDGRGTSLKEIAGVPVMGRLNKLEEVIKEKKINYLLQCADLEHTLNLLSLCRQHRITYLLLPSVLGIVGGAEKIEWIEDQPVTMVNP